MIEHKEENPPRLYPLKLSTSKYACHMHVRCDMLIGKLAISSSSLRHHWPYFALNDPLMAKDFVRNTKVRPKACSKIDHTA
jgi:hypothetical protein